MIQKTRPAIRAKATRWQVSAAAAAVATLMGLWAPNASALALGRVKVLSTLGEPLRAEIDIPQITPAEAESLRVNPGSPELFRAAGLEYNPAASNVRVSVQYRADGRPFLRLSSNRPVNDPFMDLIVEATWASGKISRDYTMLFDPQAPRASTSTAVAAAPQITAPQVTAPLSAQRNAQSARSASGSPNLASPGRAERMRAARAAAISARQSAAARAPTVARAAADAAAPPSAPGTTQVTVRRGDTASKIATRYAPANISLDQMLVAMLRANPQAFVDGNVNLLKAGAVLDLPTAADASALPAAEAQQTLIAQSRDFNAFRRKLATAATPTQTANADRSASGKLQAEVTERHASTAAPDKLTLSKGAIDSGAPGTSAAQGNIAGTQAGATAELPKNVDESSKLGAVSPTGAPQGAGATGAAPDSNAAGSGAGALASAGASASDAAAAPAPVVAANTKPAVKPAAKPQPVPEAGILDQMLDQPLIPALGLGLILLLAGFGFQRARQRRFAAEEADFLAESSAAPESFFGVSGGQRIDTVEDASHGSSVAYSPSQLDAGGEVDPVAEADVYLAYGRDEQAVDTLNEALRSNPQRVATRTKLLEIHARRQDANAFEALASQTLPLVGNDSPEWRHISELGRDLDFSNPLYQTAGHATMQAKLAASHSAPSASQLGGALSAGAAAAIGAAAAATMKPQPSERAPLVVPFDLDLDLGTAPRTPLPTPPRRAAAPVSSHDEGERTERAALDLDFSDFGGLNAPAAPAVGRPVRATPAFSTRLDTVPGDLSVSATDWLATPTGPAPLTPTAPAPLAKPIQPTQPAPMVAEAGPSSRSGMIDFDFGSLRLDLENSTAVHSASTQSRPASLPAAATGETEAAAPFVMPAAPQREREPGTATAADAGDATDALSTKLALAEAFSAIGDVDSARTMAQEVVGESSGLLKARAERFLSSIH